MLKNVAVVIMATIFFGSLIACGDKEEDTAADTAVVDVDETEDASDTGANDTGEEAQESE